MGTRDTRGQKALELACLVSQFCASLRLRTALAKPVAHGLLALLFVFLIVGIAPYLIEDQQIMADEVAVSASEAAGESAPLAHIVFFTLEEPNDANRSKLVEACKKYLGEHEGVVYFGVGVRAPEYDRPVNDQDYDVALHLVFATAKDQDVYQTHPDHVKFVEECKGLWKKVRVFDSTLQ